MCWRLGPILPATTAMPDDPERSAAVGLVVEEFFIMELANQRQKQSFSKD